MTTSPEAGNIEGVSDPKQLLELINRYGPTSEEIHNTLSANRERDIPNYALGEAASLKLQTLIENGDLDKDPNLIEKIVNRYGPTSEEIGSTSSANRGRDIPNYALGKSAADRLQSLIEAGDVDADIEFLKRLANRYGPTSEEIHNTSSVNRERDIPNYALGKSAADRLETLVKK